MNFIKNSTNNISIKKITDLNIININSDLDIDKNYSLPDAQNLNIQLKNTYKPIVLTDLTLDIKNIYNK